MKNKDFKILCKQIKDGEWDYCDGELTKGSFDNSVIIRCQYFEYLKVGGNPDFLSFYQKLILWYAYIIPYKNKLAKDAKDLRTQRLTDKIMEVQSVQEVQKEKV